MFIGHYGPALALKAVAPKAPVFALVAACQVMDYAWAGLILAGVEKASIDPSRLEGSPLVLSFMPYTHSLLGATLISLLFAAVVSAFVKSGRWAVLLAVFAAGISHWFADLLVHAPDLTLAGAPPAYGFSLWAYKWPSLALEAALALGGLWLAVRATTPSGPWGARTPWLMLLVLTLLGAVNAFQPPPSNIESVALSALGAYTAVVLIGLAMDRTRAPRA